MASLDVSKDMIVMYYAEAIKIKNLIKEVRERNAATIAGIKGPDTWFEGTMLPPAQDTIKALDATFEALEDLFTRVVNVASKQSELMELINNVTSKSMESAAEDMLKLTQSLLKDKK